MLRLPILKPQELALVKGTLPPYSKTPALKDETRVADGLGALLPCL